MYENELAGVTALVTGASRGFGRGIATALSRAGAQVVGVARDRAPLEELRAELDESFTPVAVDAADPVVTCALIDKYHPGVLVLNAGATPLPRPVHHHTWQTFSRNWDVDVAHVFHWVREALLAPLEPGSTVITLSSGAALFGSPLSGGYAGAKAAIRFLTAYAAEESRRGGLGIRFVSVLPQLTPATDLGAVFAAAYAAREGTEAAARSGGEPLTPEQAGQAITALVTDPGHDQDAYLLTAAGLRPCPSPAALSHDTTGGTDMTSTGATDMTIAGRAVLVTGANRGIGRALVAEALSRGAKRVYAGTRQPLAHPDGRVTPLTLDVTNAAQIQAAAGKVESLDILINNAGIALFDDLSDRAVLEQHLAVNFFGPYGVIQAFLPLLTRSGGAIVNNVSTMAVAPLPLTPAYAISKAAAFNLTQSLRALLAGRGVRVHAVLTGPTDTDMTRGFDIPKASAESVARAIFDGVESGEDDIFPDPASQSLADSWRNGAVKALERENAAFVAAEPVAS